MEIYFAHPKFNEAQIEASNKLISIMESCNPEQPSAEDGGVCSPTSHSYGIKINNPFDAFPAVEGSREEKAKFGNIILHNNIALMDRSDIIVAVIDDRDMGVIFELGYMHAQHKNIITVSANNYDNNIMIANSVLLHIPNVFTDKGTKALKDAIISLAKLQ